MGNEGLWDLDHPAGSVHAQVAGLRLSFQPLA